MQLTKPLPEYHFVKGDVATLVDIVNDKRGGKGYVLEFFDSHGKTLQVVVVAEDFINIVTFQDFYDYVERKVAEKQKQ